MSLEAEVPVCRVCHGESEPGRELFFPCKCDGSIKYVHQDCLQEWLKHARNKSRCELCGEELKFKKIYKEGMAWHLSVLEVAQELFPQLAAIILSSCHIALAMFCWLFILPIFSSYWMRFCWCIATNADIGHCFSVEYVWKFRPTVQFVLNTLYGGVVNICIVGCIAFALAETGRIIYKVS